MAQKNSRFDLFKYTALIRLYTFTYIPLLWWVRPSLVAFDDTQFVIKIPLFRRTQNHLKTMYFGALSMGGEAAVAGTAIKAIHDSGEKVDYIFKDFKAQFLKRAEGDVHFVCEQNKEIQALVQKALLSGEREQQTFASYALVPSRSKTEKVALFEVTLSMKKRKGKA